MICRSSFFDGTKRIGTLLVRFFVPVATMPWAKLAFVPAMPKGCMGFVRFLKDSLLSPTTSGYAIKVLYHLSRSPVVLQHQNPCHCKHHVHNEAHQTLCTPLAYSQLSPNI